jgi:hypothetical protein
MGELPNFDAYVVSVVVAATVLRRSAAFLVATGNSLLIIGNYLWQPHNANIAQDTHLYSSVTIQTVSFLVRPIALQFVLAVVASLWVRGTDEAIRRADRAEEIAWLEQREVERSRAETERTFALEEGVRYLHQSLTQWAVGDLRHPVPQMPVPVLQQVANDLNQFMERFARSSRSTTAPPAQGYPTPGPIAPGAVPSRPWERESAQSPWMEPSRAESRRRAAEGGGEDAGDPFTTELPPWLRPPRS